MNLKERLRKYSLRSGYAKHSHAAADEIERLELALIYAQGGLELAYSALEKGCYDEAMVHCGCHSASIEKVLSNE